MTTGVDELVARVAAVRSLPAAPDRRRIRVEAGVSLRDVADAVGVSHRWSPACSPVPTAPTDRSTAAHRCFHRSPNRRKIACRSSNSSRIPEHDRGG